MAQGTHKLMAAYAALVGLGVDADKAEDLCRNNRREAYRQLSMRGYTWSGETERWRPIKRASSLSAGNVLPVSRYPSQIRVIARTDEIEGVLARLEDALYVVDYEMQSLNSHPSHIKDMSVAFFRLVDKTDNNG